MGFSLSTVKTQELEVSPVLKRPCAVSSKKQEQRYSCVRHKVERQQQNELGNLAKRKRRVDSGLRWLSESL